MPLKIVRNDIVQMETDAIVNTANANVMVGTGCDSAVYKAAGYDELLNYRRENIGFVPEGEVFITPGFNLKAKFIIHAVSPYYLDENSEEKLRSCYRKSLQIAKDNDMKSIAFPLISTGTFSYPKEEGMRIALDEINSFLIKNDIIVYLVVFDPEVTALGEKIDLDIKKYIDQHYVKNKLQEEYTSRPHSARFCQSFSLSRNVASFQKEPDEDDLSDRMRHVSDTFSQHLMYLIQTKNMSNADVYKRALVDKKVFSKIKTNINYHPQKMTVLCLCVGAKLNLEESKELLARAGYALSSCDKTDIIFSYFIENEIYDMIELDIKLEEYGLPCIIS